MATSPSANSWRWRVAGGIGAALSLWTLLKVHEFQKQKQRSSAIRKEVSTPQTGHDHGHGQSHEASAHGHSHEGGHAHEDGQPCSGHDSAHSHDQGHSHDGHPCSGHGSDHDDHGHSHGNGNSCSSHEHGDGHGSHGHGHGHEHGSSGNEGPSSIASQQAATFGNLKADFSMPLVDDIERRLKIRFDAVKIEVEDEGGSCSSAKIAVLLVSKDFEGVKRLDRQRLVQSLLREDLDSNRIHALSLKIHTPTEYARLGAK
eukprot:TRINITY_DN649_c0_g4_i1.p1 TRINITY_DN649_c0_g4~~TRINITY_DN649_c0_g4_i1.p1  ORF type:complete len:277 (+),score=37.44 TRINITY_DN649_c0_g4_i1:60-833(+)